MIFINSIKNLYNDIIVIQGNKFSPFFIGIEDTLLINDLYKNISNNDTLIISNLDKSNTLEINIELTENIESEYKIVNKNGSRLGYIINNNPKHLFTFPPAPDIM